MADLLVGLITVVLTVVAYSAYLVAVSVVVPVATLVIFGRLAARYAVVVRGVLIVRSPKFEVIPPYRPQDEGELEPAYRQYFFGPAIRDLRQVIILTWRRYREAVHDDGTAITVNCLTAPKFGRPLSVPVGVACWIGLIAGAAVATVVLAAVSVLHVVAVLAAQVAAGTLDPFQAADDIMAR